MEEKNNIDERIEVREHEIDTEIVKINKKISRFTFFAWVAVVLGCLIGIYGIWKYYNASFTEVVYNLNLLGDYLSGGVASLWSLAGLFFIYVAFLGQKVQILNQEKELMYNRHEVINTRLELEGQKKEMKEQNENLKRQRAETTFFKLLDNRENLLKTFESEVKGEIKKGKDLLDIVASENKSNLIHKTSFSQSKNNIGKSIKALSFAPIDDPLFKKSFFIKYLNITSHLCGFIDNSFDENNKVFFHNIITNQLSDNEKFLLEYAIFCNKVDLFSLNTLLKDNKYYFADHIHKAPTINIFFVSSDSDNTIIGLGNNQVSMHFQGQICIQNLSDKDLTIEYVEDTNEIRKVLNRDIKNIANIDGTIRINRHSDYTIDAKEIIDYFLRKDEKNFEKLLKGEYDKNGVEILQKRTYPFMFKTKYEEDYWTLSFEIIARYYSPSYSQPEIELIIVSSKFNSH